MAFFEATAQEPGQVFQTEGRVRREAWQQQDPGHKGEWSAERGGSLQGDGQGIPIPK